MLLQLPTLTLWCSSIKYVFKWPKIPVLIRTTKFSEENRNMTRQKKCLLLRVCLVKSKLNQYRRCCLNYALLKKKEREKSIVHQNLSIFIWNEFDWGQWRADSLECFDMSVLSQYRVNTHNSLFTLLQFDSLLWYFVWSDLIENTFLNSSSPLSITKQRGARGIPLSSKSKKREKKPVWVELFPSMFPSLRSDMQGILD